MLEPTTVGARVVQPSGTARAVARGVAPMVRIVERTGQWPRLFQAFGRRVVPGARGFGDYRPGEHDVVVATYDKSGTNWVMQIVHQVATLGHGTFRHIHDVAPWPDGPGDDPGIVALDVPTWHGTVTGQRPVKTHLPRPQTPLTDAARYVVVVRDPKDVVVSSYHFIRDVLLGPLMPRPGTWVDLFISEQGLRPSLGSWPVHIDGWWRERHRPNVLVLRYEELAADLAGGIGRVAELMGVGLDPDAAERIRAHSTFDAMRAVADRFSLGPFSPLGAPGGRMIRRGAVGASGELLTRDQRRRIDDHCEQTLARLGSDFPYAELYRGS